MMLIVELCALLEERETDYIEHELRGSYSGYNK